MCFNDEVSFNLYINQLQKKEVENDMLQKRLNNLVLCFGFNIHFDFNVQYLREKERLNQKL